MLDYCMSGRIGPLHATNKKYLCSVLCSLLLCSFGCVGATFTPVSRSELKTAVDACLLLESPLKILCSAAMNTWDVSKVTDMHNIFESRKDFNADIR